MPEFNVGQKVRRVGAEGGNILAMPVGCICTVIDGDEDSFFLRPTAGIGSWWFDLDEHADQWEPIRVLTVVRYLILMVANGQRINDETNPARVMQLVVASEEQIRQESNLYERAGYRILTTKKITVQIPFDEEVGGL